MNSAANLVCLFQGDGRRVVGQDVAEDVDMRLLFGCTLDAVFKDLGLPAAGQLSGGHTAVKRSSPEHTVEAIVGFEDLQSTLQKINMFEC